MADLIYMATASLDGYVADGDSRPGRFRAWRAKCLANTAFAG